MAELAAESWIARAKLGLVVLDRESGEFFLRSKQATFPGKALAELFDMKEGALGEEVARNILHIDGDDHRRLRNLVNPAFTPRAADKWRPVMRDYIAGLFDEVTPAGQCDAVTALCKPYPAMTIATVVGAPPGRRRAAGLVVALDPAAVRRPDPGRAPRRGRARVRGALRVSRRADRRQARRPGRGPALDSDRRPRWRRPPRRRRASQPGAQRLGRRGRHDPVTARPCAAPVRRPPRSVGSARGRARAGHERGLGDHPGRPGDPVHGADRASRTWSTAASRSRPGRS